MPLTAVVRFLPFGRPSDFQPYVGAGIGAAELPVQRDRRVRRSRDARDLSRRHFTEDRYDRGTDSPRWPPHAARRRRLRADVEGRYQWGSGDTGGAANEFLGDKIDLGGGSLNFGFLIRF